MQDAIIQNSPFPIFIYDADNLKFLEVNNAAVELYGYTREEFLTMDLTDLYSPEDIQSILITSNESRKEGEFTGPWRQIKKNGDSVVIMVSRTAVDFRGTKANLSVIRDVSEEFETKQKLKLYKAFWDYSGEILIHTDREGFIKRANENLSKTLGYSEPILSLSILNFVYDDDREQLSENIFKPGLTSPQTINIRLKDSNGNPVPVEIAAIPILDYNGEVTAFNLLVKSGKPFTPQKVSETPEPEIGKINATFLSNLFHELLTPLNVIIGFGQELTESIENPSEDQKEAIEIINQNQSTLLDVMNIAAEYVALIEENVEVSTKVIPFIELLKQIESNTRNTSSDRNVELAYGKISSSLSLETDEQKLVTLLTVFINFALRIAREKSSIYISAYLWDPEHCVVSIKDNRLEITPKFLEDIKLLFTENENILRQKYGVSRFSIRVFKRLIDLLHAEFKEIVRDGTAVEYGLILPLKFPFTLPIEPDVESRIEKVSEKPEAPEAIIGQAETQSEIPYAEPVAEQQQIPVTNEVGSGEESKEQGSKSNGKLNLSKLSCLYVEDQVDSQILFRVQMKDLKSIDFAESLENALPLLQSQKFDFVIMDINLKGEYNGLDALRVIQKMPTYKDVPVIAATAYALPGDKDKFIDAGFSGFIPKPLMRDKLTAALKDVLN